MDFLPDWVKAIWEVLSKVLKLTWTCFTIAWAPILGFVALIASNWQFIEHGYETFTTHAAVAWSILTSADGAMSYAANSGWPTWLANGLGYVNQYFPVGECAAMLGTLITTIVSMALLRVIKSFIPTLAS
jgi:hypothetical protein